jgi:hypothetical protein
MSRFESKDLGFLSEMYSRAKNPQCHHDLRGKSPEEIEELQADILFTLTRELGRKRDPLLDDLMKGVDHE